MALATIHRVERGHSGFFDSTWRRLLDALASIAPLNPDEIDALVGTLGWSVDTLTSINANAAPQIPTPADRRRTARSRVLAVFDANEDIAVEMAEAVESIHRLLTAARARAQAATPEPAAPTEAELSDMIHRMAEQEHRPGRSARVVLPTVRQGGDIIERFEYYTPDGRRLVPEPPKAKPLRGDRHA